MTVSLRHAPQGAQDTQRLNFVLAITGIVAGLLGLILIVEFAETPRFPKIKPLIANVESRSGRIWIPYGCEDVDIVTDKLGFRQCTNEPKIPKKQERKLKTSLLKKLLQNLEQLLVIDVSTVASKTEPMGDQCKNTAECDKIYCLWHARPSGKGTTCDLPRNFFFISDGQSIMMVPLRPKIKKEQIMHMNETKLKSLDVGLMKEFFNEDNDWLHQFCPRFQSTQNLRSCQASPYFFVENKELKRKRNIHSLTYQPGKKYILWSDTGKPSAIHTAAISVQPGPGGVKFSKNIKTTFIFNNGDEPRGVVLSGRDVLFFTAIHRPMRYLMMAGRYWKGYVAAINLDQFRIGQRRALVKIFTHRKIIEPDTGV